MGSRSAARTKAAAIEYCGGSLLPQMNLRGEQVLKLETYIENLLTFDVEAFFVDLKAFSTPIVIGYLIYEVFQLFRLVITNNEYFIDGHTLLRRWIADAFGIIIAILYAFLKEKALSGTEIIPLATIISLSIYQSKDHNDNCEITDIISGTVLFLSITIHWLFPCTIYIGIIALNGLLLYRDPDHYDFFERIIGCIVEIIEIVIGTVLISCSQSVFTVYYAIILVAFNLVIPQFNPAIKRFLAEKLWNKF